MAAHVGDEFHALRGAHQCAAFALLGQREMVAHLGHGQLVPEVAGTGLKDQLHLARVQAGVEIAVDGKLRATARKSCETDAQVRHDPQDLRKTDSTPTRWPRGWVLQDGSLCGLDLFPARYAEWNLEF